MFGKLNRNTLSHHFNKAKNFLGNAYHQTKGFLNDVDHGVKIFKSVYGELQPYLEKYGAKHLKTGINKAITGYDDIRSKVRGMENDFENIRSNLNY